MLIAVAFAIAAVAVLLLIVRVARRYRAMPKRIPIGINYDGRPRGRTGKWVAFVPPVVLAAIVAALGYDAWRATWPASDEVRLAAVFVELAVLAAFLSWMLDRQIELARGMIVRVPATQLWRAAGVLIASLLILIAVAFAAGG